MEYANHELLLEPPPLPPLKAPTHRLWRLVRGAVIGILLCSILGFYAVVQYRAFVPGYGEPDLDGYFWLAKRIAHFQSPHEKPDNPYRFQSHVWVENPAGYVTPKFAPGFALVMAPFSYFGDEAMFCVSPLAGGLALLAVFLLFCRWMDVWISLLATAVVSVNPIFIMYCGYMLSHAVDLCVLSWGMLFLFAWIDRPTISRACAAGLILGFAVALRHVNALLGLCVLVALLAVVLRRRQMPGRP
jgi:4-amino-4-deoxy-L-arabinose transferase-like glycosyltransferase